MKKVNKKAADKRTNYPRASDYVKSFIKDWKRLSESGRYDMKKLKHVMLLLIENEEPLGAEWLEHELQGEWSGCRECHIGGDFLLIYKIQKIYEKEQVIFIRAGTHSELF